MLYESNKEVDCAWPILYLYAPEHMGPISVPILPFILLF
jgi:hypothetical protein